MARIVANQFVPDYAVHPGEILEEHLDTLGMNQTELVNRTGLAGRTINEIIQGKAPVTSRTALILERTVGHTAQFWSNLQQLYDETQARLVDQKQLESGLEWLKSFPVKEMVKNGWIKAFQDKGEQFGELLRFFGVASPAQWDLFWGERQGVAFRQSQKSINPVEAVSAWLCQGEIQARAIQCGNFSRERFRNALMEARSLTREPPVVFHPRVVELCKGVGVAVVFVRELPKTGISGATRWLTPNKALIQLSLRYKSDDQLWFTFFHEAGHILLHGKKDTFLEDVGEQNQEKECEASQFAADLLITPGQWTRFKQSFPRTLASVEHFAKESGIAPGIVVGRLQREKVVDFSWGNGLKRRLVWHRAGESWG
jgi:HTH-type transcriptional regulator/antitoxin HigA